jgi:hypothetical protein
MVVSNKQGDGELVVSDNEAEGGRDSRRKKGMEKEEYAPRIKKSRVEAKSKKRAHQKEFPQQT